jgi:hypothetical protein
VHVHAEPQPDASRWLWLVKWLLLIPHAIVLVFLWMAFVVMSIVAFVAILVTGRYPRSVFDFNVGVLRWSWRVSFYGYSALATDRYPPFTLADDPDYPAHLEVDYPDHLSRGLVLVKWWLLALPHYVVVGLLVGGGTWWVTEDDSPARFAWGGGLVGLLVLIGAVVLAVTGTYPRPLYDLVLGLNRWVLRVSAYAALMTDTYPPFRLDQGPADPDDPGASRAAPDPAPPPAGSALRGSSAPATVRASGSGAPPPARRGGWTTGRVVALIAGSVIGVGGLAVLTGGAAMQVVHHTVRDDAGFVRLADNQVTSAGYAVVTPPVRIESASAGLPRRMLGELRIRVLPDAGRTVFVGLAPTDDVDGYLSGVARTIPGSGGDDDQDLAGGAPTGPPTQQGFWDVSQVGTSPFDLTWSPRNGDWSLVLMNADGSADVGADVEVGAELPWLGGLGATAFFVGLVLTAAGITLVASSTRRASAPQQGLTENGAPR